jgi:hypothetical protein
MSALSVGDKFKQHQLWPMCHVAHDAFRYFDISLGLWVGL